MKRRGHGHSVQSHRSLAYNSGLGLYFVVIESQKWGFGDRDGDGDRKSRRYSLRDKNVEMEVFIFCDMSFLVRL